MVFPICIFIASAKALRGILQKDEDILVAYGSDSPYIKRLPE